MAGRRSGPVLVAHHAAVMRRILRFNLAADGIDAVEVGSARACREWLQRCPVAVLLLDPDILTDRPTEVELCSTVREHHVPVLVLCSAPEHRRVARALGGAPFCNRPDEIERVSAAVRDLLAGSGLPALV